MADPGARITVDDEEVKKALGKILNRIKNPRPMLAEIGETMVSSTQDRFESGRSPEGKPWPKSHRTRVGGGQVLVDTARLKNSVNYQVRSDEVAVGTNVKYAGTHQFGAKRGSFGTVSARIPEHVRSGGIRVRSHTRTMKLPWGDIPARPYLGISDSDRREIVQIAEDELLRT